MDMVVDTKIPRFIKPAGLTETSALKPSQVKYPLSLTEGNQPPPLSKTTQYDIRNAVTFYLGEESAKTLVALGYTAAQATTIINEGYWQYIVTSIQEGHSEGHSIVNPFADTFLVYTTGAMPVSINLEGVLYTGVTQDHRMDFLEFYLTKLRGTLLRRHKMIIVMMMKDTVFRIRVQSINIVTNSELQDWTSMSLQGIGFAYKVYNFSNTINVSVADKPAMLDKAPAI